MQNTKTSPATWLYTGYTTAQIKYITLILRGDPTGPIFNLFLIYFRFCHFIQRILHTNTPNLTTHTVLISVGINNRSVNTKHSTEQVLQIFRQAHTTFPNARIYIPLINFSADLISGVLSVDTTIINAKHSTEHMYVLHMLYYRLTSHPTQTCLSTATSYPYHAPTYYPHSHTCYITSYSASITSTHLHNHATPAHTHPR